MAREEIKNIAHSVRAKLLRISKQEGRRHEWTLLRYCQERLLYRLSISPYKDRFILKGGLFFLAHHMTPLRPTRDMDLLSRTVLPSGVDLIALFREITRIPCPEDGVRFTSNLSGMAIKEDADYEGFRLLIPCELGTLRERLQIDIGYGDTIVPGPVPKDFPVLLTHPVPRIQAYSTESVIAEKFQAMVFLGSLNSRLKDFYDIHFLAQNQPFQKGTLRQAIETTFRQRRTDLENRRRVFSSEFMTDAQREKDWRRFLERNEIESPGSFEFIMSRIRDFLEPVAEGHEDERVWSPAQWRWTAG